MTSNEALKKAYDFFKQNLKISGLAYAAEISGGWIAYAGNPNEFIVGRPVAFINRETGEISPFSLFDKKNSELVENKKPIEIPDELKK